MTSHKILQFCLTLIASVVLAGPAFAQSNVNPTPVSPVTNPCPRFTAGSVVHNPPALFSKNGVLTVEFSYQTTMDAAGRQLFCYMTPSGLENPTLHISPGDHLIITITNNTPAGINPMAITGPTCGTSTMDSSSVNIHFHGTNTAPVCGQDEVIKTTVNAGQTFQYNVSFPANEPPGLYWYHPHIHGQAEGAVLGGASGAIVVEGIQNVKLNVSGLRHRVLVIRDQPQVQGLDEGPGGCVNDVPYQDLTVNNVPIDSFQAVPGGPVTFTPAVLHMTTNEWQLMRVVNASADSILDLEALYDGVAQNLILVGIDGVPINSQDGGVLSSQLQATSHFRLPPASRVEFLLHAPASSVKFAHLLTTAVNTGANGDCDPWRTLFVIKQVGAMDADEPAPDDKVPATTTVNPTQNRFAGLAAAPVAKQRLVYFDENADQTQFYMAVEGQPEAVFDPNGSPAIIATQGTTEEWIVQNRAQENHEFHFHQVHFLVENQGNFEINGQVQAPNITGQFLDMIEVPGWDGDPTHPYPSVRLKIDFRGPDIGTFVFHCHILGHEDLGMMNIIQVVAPGSAELTKPQAGSASSAPVTGKAVAGTSSPAKGPGPSHGMHMPGMTMDQDR